MFQVPEARTEVSRQSIEHRRTLLLKHPLKTKTLPRIYEFIGGKRQKSYPKNKMKFGEALCLEGPPTFGNTFVFIQLFDCYLYTTIYIHTQQSTIH